MDFEDRRPGSGDANPLVIIADDEHYAQLLLQRVMEREGFRIETATDGNMAIEKARELLPDLILMDIQMPGIDGFEAVTRLREDPRTNRIPIIVVTAAAREPADVARGLGLGADDYIQKPFNTSELVARARSKIRAHHLEERLQQRTEELEAMIRIGSELNEELALDELADRIMSATLEQLPAAYAALILLDVEGRPVLHRWRGWGKANPLKEQFFEEHSMVGYALVKGEAVLVEDVDTDQRISMIFDRTPCKSGIATPFKHHGQILGMLVLGNPGVGHFIAGDLRVLRSIGEQAALAIRNAQLYTELQGYAQGLESMVEARTAALQAAQAQLIQAEKLASLGTLAAGVAHEVNNPLHSIQNCLDMAVEDVEMQRPVEYELLDMARSEVDRITRIVKSLLEFARPGKPELEAVDINETVNEVLSLARKELEHGKVTVRTDLQASREIKGSADQLKQVFLNLVLNARDAMPLPNGGRLTVSTYDQYDQNGYVALCVRDTGIGIKPDVMPQLFDPFFTTKASGTGLGLAVSYSIIQSHEGRIEVQSEPGKGTEFTVYLPVMEAH